MKIINSNNLVVKSLLGGLLLGGLLSLSAMSWGIPDIFIPICLAACIFVLVKADLYIFIFKISELKFSTKLFAVYIWNLVGIISVCSIFNENTNSDGVMSSGFVLQIDDGFLSWALAAILAGVIFQLALFALNTLQNPLYALIILSWSLACNLGDAVLTIGSYFLYNSYFRFDRFLEDYLAIVVLFPIFNIIGALLVSSITSSLHKNQTS